MPLDVAFATAHSASVLAFLLARSPAADLDWRPLSAIPALLLMPALVVWSTVSSSTFEAWRPYSASAVRLLLFCSPFQVQLGEQLVLRGRPPPTAGLRGALVTAGRTFMGEAASE